MGMLPLICFLQTMGQARLTNWRNVAEELKNFRKNTDIKKRIMAQ